MTKYLLMASLVLVVLAGCEPKPSESMSEALDDSALEHAEKHADKTYICPMHSQIVRGEPGSCPICGMDLVELEITGEGDGDFPEIAISAIVEQNMGVRTARVAREDLWKYIETVGLVAYDEDRLTHIHSRAPGWVEVLKVRTLGEPVKKGDVLLEYFSPEILTAQEELVLAARGGRLLEAARKRLRLLDVPNAVARAIEKTGKTRRRSPILARADGIVAEIGLREGMYIKPDMTLYTLADLSTVWVTVDVFEHQINWVAEGRPAEIQVAARPGRKWEGTVDYIYPELERGTRTLKVRLKFDNKDGQLKPNMFADVVIYSGPKPGVLTVPREALIISGNSTRVIKKLLEGKFQPVLVTTGMQTSSKVEILDGLEEGERIVVSGQFLIDSESNLQASLRRLSAE